MPAAYCGIVGFKQTNGMLSNDGVIPLSWSLDHVGALAHTVEDVALMTEAMATAAGGEEERAGSALALTDLLGRSIEGIRVGVDRRNHLDRPQADPALAERFEAAVDELDRLGAQISEIEIPHYAEIVDATMITIYIEGFAYHREHLREQLDRFCVASRLGLLGGALFTAADLVIVQRARAAAVSDLLHLYKTVDIIVSPTVVNVAPSVSQGYDMGQVVAGLATPIWNGVGNPAITVPMGFNDDGLPFGLQLAGRHHEDSVVLQVAAAYESATHWEQHRPDVFSLAEAEPEA
jgi:aspartyl-tRNA(Asn)/glutamyl-tRNA(Gln) amidotransferase subunit A